MEQSFGVSQWMTKYNHRKALEVTFVRWIKKTVPAKKFVECLKEKNVDLYRTHMEERFNPSMNWMNYGQKWIVDHIIPLYYFDLFDPTQISLAWSLDNLCPIDKQENRLRGACIEASWLMLLNSKPIDSEVHRELIEMVGSTVKQRYQSLNLQSISSISSS